MAEYLFSWLWTAVQSMDAVVALSWHFSLQVPGPDVEHFGWSNPTSDVVVWQLEFPATLAGNDPIVTVVVYFQVWVDRGQLRSITRQVELAVVVGIAGVELIIWVWPKIVVNQLYSDIGRWRTPTQQPSFHPVALCAGVLLRDDASQ